MSWNDKARSRTRVILSDQLSRAGENSRSGRPAIGPRGSCLHQKCHASNSYKPAYTGEEPDFPKCDSLLTLEQHCIKQLDYNFCEVRLTISVCCLYISVNSSIISSDFRDTQG